MELDLGSSTEPETIILVCCAPIKPLTPLDEGSKLPEKNI